MKYFDNIGNEIQIGDEVFVLLPKSDTTYRKAIIIDFRITGIDYHEVLIEYHEDRFYCDKPWYKQNKGDKLNFSNKSIKRWRSNKDIILINNK